MPMGYNPSSLTLTTNYITHSNAETDGNNFDRPFIFAYPDGQTLDELSPEGQIAGTPASNTGTIRVSPTTWP